MMLHTVIAPGDIFPAKPMDFAVYELPGGKWVNCIKTAKGDLISRLISTDPRDYLQSRFTPGKPYTNLN